MLEAIKEMTIIALLCHGTIAREEVLADMHRVLEKVA
jgi:hypothetical protein